MKKRFFLIYIFVILCITSCSNMIKNENRQEKARILINFSSSRTILPVVDLTLLTDIVIEGDLQGSVTSHFKHSFETQLSATSIGIVIEPGIWDFTISAKMNNIEFSGTLSNKEIKEGNNILSFSLELFSLGYEDDKGEISITLNFPNDNHVLGVKAGLFSIEDDKAIEGFELKSLRPKNNSVTYTISSVPVGNYRFKAFLYADETYTSLINVYRELVTVIEDLTSSAIRTIENLNQVYSIVYAKNGGIFSSSYIAPEVYTRSSEFLLSTAENIIKDGYAFIGWYETEDFSSERITKIEKNTIDNKVFYAKWAVGKVITTSNISSLDLSNIEKDYTLAVVGDVDLKLLAKKLKSAKNTVILDLFASSFTSLDDNLFSGCDKITDIVLPENLCKIGKQSFYGCSSLKHFTITERINDIGENAFGNCSSLLEFVVSKENTFYKSIDGILFTYKGENLVQYPAGKIDSEYTIPIGTVSINEGAFSENLNINSIVVSSTVESINTTAFNGCSNLNCISVDYANSVYDDNNGSGILYSNNVIVRYPEGKQSNLFTLPAWVSKIEDYAFYNCKNLESLIIPSASELDSIGSYAFYGCSALININLPESLNYIGGNAFDGCGSHFNYCTIVFDTNGGSEIKSLSVKSGNTIKHPENPTKKGYIFSGWYTDNSLEDIFSFSTNITSNRILYAKWKIINYSITYYLDEGINSSINPYNYTIESDQIYFAVPEKKGYSFVGWYDNSDFEGNAITAINSETCKDLSLYAEWNIIEYTISYSLDGGNNVSTNPNKYTIETESIVLGNPNKKGYSFDGWYLDPSYNGERQTSLNKGSYGDITYYAKWLKQCSVIYVTEYGTVPKSITVNEGEKLSSSQLPELIMDDYFFNGWYDGNTIVQGDSYIVTDNVTLTAKWERKIRSGDGFIYVEGGTFNMGSNGGDKDEKPIHSVTVNAFYMNEHEVTQSEYKAIMEINPSHFYSNPENGEIQDNRPVESVSWYDAIYFCNKKSIKDNRTPCYSVNGNTSVSQWNYIPHKGNSISGTISCNFAVNGYRLPTEAEWEFAARGGNKSKGYKYSGSNNVEIVAWYSNNNADKTHEVKKKASNELGLYDMSGNVMEWCWDWYGDYTNDYQINPTGAYSSSYRVLRGGNWCNFDYVCTVSRRGSAYGEPYRRGDFGNYPGFRLVYSTNTENNKIQNNEQNNSKNDFMFVEGGTFYMGNENGLSDEVPVHSESVSSFYICNHEVTQEEFESIMGINPSYFLNNPANGENQNKRPVENVNWYDAITYCNKRSLKEGLTPCYSVSGVSNWQTLSYNNIPTDNNQNWNNVVCNWNANGYRLPTEVEWEFAARGGKKSKGYTYSGSDNVDDVSWYNNNSEKITHEVMKKTCNELGLYDMSGNVCEWCWDWYKLYDDDNNTGRRVVRNGSFLTAQASCKVSCRFITQVTMLHQRNYTRGFRVVHN